MGHADVLSALESFYRSLGLPVGRRERLLLVRGDVPFTVEITPDLMFLRATALTDIEATERDALRLAELNFLRYGVKLCVDTEGFIAVVAEIPLRYVKDESPLSIHEGLVQQALNTAKALRSGGHTRPKTMDI